MLIISIYHNTRIAHTQSNRHFPYSYASYSINPCFTAEKMILVQHCHAVWRHCISTICLCIVYDEYTNSLCYIMMYNRFLYICTGFNSQLHLQKL